MRKKIYVLLTAMMLSVAAAVKGQVAYVNVNDGTEVTVRYYSPTTVRIQKQKTKPAKQRGSLAIVGEPIKEFKTTETPAKLRVTTEKMTVEVDKKTGLVSMRCGKINFGEKAYSLEKRGEGPDKDAYIVRTTFGMRKGEKIYGLGTLQNGKMTRNNTEVMIEQTNLEDFQNILQSIDGWGLYWDNYSRTKFKSTDDEFTFDSELGDGVDYYFMAPGKTDDVIGEIRALTGRQPMYPLWTFGYWQSKERYVSDKEITDVVRKYRDTKVPLDGIVQDWQYWGSNYTWNAMEFISDNFTESKKMIRDIHGMKAHLMLSIWSDFGPMTKQFRELEKEGLLFDFETWPQSGLSPWPPRMDYPSGVRVYDVFSEKGREIYCKYLKHLYDEGIDAWWMDSTDPDYKDPKDSDYDQKAGDGTWRRYRNAFPLEAVRGVYEAQRKWGSDKRVFIMTRSAFAGQQRYASGLWSGDVKAGWGVFRAQIPLGLNYTLTGCPNFNTDIGGFFAHDYATRGRGTAPKNPQYQELYVRWMQYGLFNPVFRSHGTSCAKEVWEFGTPGETIYDAIVEQIQFRYRLLPYLYTLTWESTSGNGSYMRPLFADFGADKRTHEMGHEFMFGKEILAAPVVKAEYTEEKIDRSKPKAEDRQGLDGWNAGEVKESTGIYPKVDFSGERVQDIYLPKGTDWYDFWTGKKYKGGQDIKVSTLLKTVPMMVRVGSIVPLGPEMEYVGQKDWKELEVRVYPGADGRFDLYEDEGDNYNYEKGEYSIIPMTWSEKTKTLTIGERKGSYKGMIEERTFKVVLPDGKTESVEYKGEKKAVRL